MVRPEVFGMLQSSKMIFDYVKIIKETLSLFVESEDNSLKIMSLLMVSDRKIINDIWDCCYVLEDSELAKVHYLKYGPEGRVKEDEIGNLYLRTYGVLNAVYLQKGALDTLSRDLEVDLGKYKADILEYRRIFGAHTTSLYDKRTYILSRLDLKQGYLKGYSHDLDFKNGNISELISQWDNIFLEKISLIVERIINKTTWNNKKIRFLRRVLQRLEDMRKNSIIYTDVWNDNEIAIKLVC